MESAAPKVTVIPVARKQVFVHPCCITIFGFLPSTEGEILEKFAECGDIISFWPSPDSNYMHIRYSQRQHAQLAHKLNGERLKSNVMIGVKFCSMSPSAREESMFKPAEMNEEPVAAADVPSFRSISTQTAKFPWTEYMFTTKADVQDMGNASQISRRKQNVLCLKQPMRVYSKQDLVKPQPSSNDHGNAHVEGETLPIKEEKVVEGKPLEGRNVEENPNFFNFLDDVASYRKKKKIRPIFGARKRKKRKRRVDASQPRNKSQVGRLPVVVGLQNVKSEPRPTTAYTASKLRNRAFGDYKCDICEKRFRFPMALENHARCHKGEQPMLQCDKCTRTFVLESQLREHLAGAHTSIRHQCKSCGHLSRSNNLLKMHLKKVHGVDGPFQCDTCGSKFKFKHYLSQHLLFVHNEGYMRCDHCDMTFTSDRRLSMHQLTVHNNKEGLTCTFEYCMKEFTTREKLKAHIRRMHTSTKKFPCNQCSRECCSGSSLKHHKLAVHRGIKICRYFCDQCDFKSIMKYSLEVHKAKQHGGKSTSALCPHCGKEYIHSHILSRHIFAVHAPKRFPCQQCSMRFPGQGALNLHVKVVHERVKDYVCEKCARAFTMKSKLNRHMISVHSSEKPFECEDCNRRFCLREVLTAHKRRCHPDIENVQQIIVAEEVWGDDIS